MTRLPVPPSPRRRTPAGLARLWRDDAACRDSDDPELWWPIATTGEMHERQVREAKVWCWSCPVQRECLADALSGGLSDQHGIWGGMTEQERIALLRRRQRDALRAARSQEQ